MKNFRALLVAAACLLPTLGLADTVTLNPTADAYVQNGRNAAKNYGTNTQLRAQASSTAASNYDSHLRFDTATAVGQVTSAKLRLYTSLSKAGNVSSSVHGVADTGWGETTITWNNKPALGNEFSKMNVASTSYAWKEIDVTAYVQAEKAAGRNLISLGLHNGATSSVYVRANSLNATSNRPELVIVTATPNVPPTVSMTSPAGGASFTAPASITLSANAADSDGSIASVAFYNGTTLIGTDTTAPFSISWTGVAAGSYSLTARATDNQGAVTTSAPVAITVNLPANVAPTVSLISPVNGSTHVSGQALVIEASAADSDGSITSVAFHANGTLLSTATGTPYKLTTSLAAGSYSLTATATDNEGAATTSAPVSITVTPAPNVLPTVSMTGPADGSTYVAPASIPLSADAADSDGSIVAVEFYNGGTLIASVTTPPYTTTWNDVPVGNYSVRARAVDDRGGETYSNTIAVNVTVPPPVAAGMYYIYADHLNTPRVITDGTNKVVWRWDSDPFGADAANEDPDGDGAKFRYNLRFPGQYYDKETGLHYNYFRDYEPGTGRYVQADPIGIAGGLNLYGYANQNPLGYSDQLGLAPFSQFPVYGNWCGPGWTGGKLGSFDLNRPYDYAVPVDRLDGCCREHDICYAKCRTTQKCESKEQASCFRECDRTLATCSGKSNGTWSFKGVIGTYMGLSNPQPEECVCKQ